MRISSSIPNMVNGVSQQPAALRLASQSAAEFNRMPSVVDGNKRRPPTEHLAELFSGTLGDAHFHTINRDSTERYLATFLENADIRVNDIDGTSKTVNFAEVERYFLDDAVTAATGVAHRVYIPDAESTINLATSGITTATVIWERADDEDFSSGVTTLRTDTTDTDATVAWDPATLNGKYVRARCSAYTSGTIDAIMTWKDTSYLQTSTPSEDLRTATVADYTFVVNRDIVPEMSTELSPDNGSEALVSVKQVGYSVTYEIYIDGTLRASYATGTSGALETTTVAADLEADLISGIGANYTIARQGSSIHILRDDGSDFEVKVVDSKANTYLKVAKNTVQRFTDLPIVAPTGFTVRVIGDAGADEDDYYVKFEPNNDGATFDEGQWIETVAPGIPYKLAADTMPHALVREADGTFTFGQLTWNERTAGDVDTAAQPSFVDNAGINDVFLFRNRLGFLADDNVILSEPSEFFNFFPTTVTTVLDSNPIDISASGVSKVSILQWAVPFHKSLLIFSDSQQFRLESGADSLTTETAELPPTTDYLCSVSAKPAKMGSTVFFGSNSGDYSSVREYFLQPDSSRDDAAEVTGHVPSYLGSSIKRVVGAPNYNFVATLTDGSDTELGVYKYFYDGQQKLQSAWSKWTFNDATILSADFIENELFLVIQYSDGVYLEKLAIEDGRKDTDVDWGLFHLDRRIDETQCSSVTYSAGTGLTTFNLPYTVQAGVDYLVVTRPDGAESVGVVAQSITPSGTTITVSGDWSSKKVFIGQTYSSTYTFSTIFVRDDKDVIQEGRLMLNHMNLQYATTGYFQVTVNPTHADASVHTFTGRITGDASNVIGDVAYGSGEFRVPIMAENTKVTITISTDSFLPASFTAAEWEGRFNLRSKRY